MSTKRAVFWLTILSLIIVVVWFGKGLMFGGGEEGMPFYNPMSYLQSTGYSWNEAQAGYDMVLLLPRIPYFAALAFLFKHGVNAIFLQAATFFILICLGCLSIYFLVKETTTDNLVAFFASVFYLLNPYSMIQIWGRGIYAQFFAFALVPAFLLFSVLGLRRKNLLFFLLAIFISIILSPAFVFPTQILVIWIPVSIYLVFYIWSNKHNISVVRQAVLSVVCLGVAWLLAQAWWMWPYIKSLSASVSKLGDIKYNIGSLRGISNESSFVVVIRLIHKFLLTGTYGDIYSSGLFRVLSWIIPIMLLLSLFVCKKLKDFGFYIALLLLSLFIVMGTNSPLGGIFEWLFRNISPFQGFRNPYEKAGILLLLSVTPLFAIGLNKLSGLFKWVVVFLVCGLYVWPMWTGQFAGGVNFNPWFKVPAYYQQANNWIVSQDKDSRIIQLPLDPGDGVKYTWNHSFQGVESGEFLFSNPSIGRNIAVNKDYYNVLLDRFGVLQKNAFGPDPDISDSQFRSPHLSDELVKLNVRYIILHRDVDEKLSSMQTSQATSDLLNIEPNIQKVKTFGLLDIYEVKSASGFNYVYSPDSQTRYEKINPTLYKFSIKNAGSLANLFLLTKYDPGWKVIVDGKEIGTHSLLFSYANSWKITKSGSYSGYLKYQPQDYVEQGERMSILSVGFISILGIFLLKTRYK